MLDIANRQEAIHAGRAKLHYHRRRRRAQYVHAAEIAGKYTVTVALAPLPAVPAVSGSCLTPPLPSLVVPSYRITATVAGMQANDCNLTLDSLGIKTPPGKWK